MASELVKYFMFLSHRLVLHNDIQDKINRGRYGVAILCSGVQLLSVPLCALSSASVRSMQSAQRTLRSQDAVRLAFGKGREAVGVLGGSTCPEILRKEQRLAGAPS